MASSSSLAPPPKDGHIPLSTQVGGHDGVMTDATGSLVIKPSLPQESEFYTLLSQTSRPTKYVPFKSIKTDLISSSSPSQADPKSRSAQDPDPNPTIPPNSPYHTYSIASWLSRTFSSFIPSSPFSDGQEGEEVEDPQTASLYALKRFTPRFLGVLKLEGVLGEEGLLEGLGEGDGEGKEGGEGVESEVKINVDGTEEDESKTPTQATQPITTTNEPKPKEEKKSKKSKPTESLVLQNLSFPFSHPSLMDIKLGTVLYDTKDPNLTQEKKERMEKRARESTTGVTGMRITGFSVYRSKGFKFEEKETLGEVKVEEDGGGEEEKIGKDWGYEVKPEGLSKGLTNFFPVPNPIASSTTSSNNNGKVTPEQHKSNILRILTSLLSSLATLHSILSTLEARLPGSSLLIIYESDPEVLNKSWKLVDSGKIPGDGLAPEDEEDYSDSDENDYGYDSSSEEEDRFFGSKGPAGLVAGYQGKPKGKGKGRARSTSTNGLSGKVAKKIKTGIADGQPVDSSDQKDQDEESKGNSSSPAKSSSTSSSSGKSDSELETDEEDTESDIDVLLKKKGLTPPFTLRLIDFAHTRLTPGEGADEGVLLGIRSLGELIRGRIEEIVGAEKGGEAEAEAVVGGVEVKGDEVKVE